MKHLKQNSLIAILAFFFAFPQFSNYAEEPAATSGKKIAVLPLKNLKDQKDTDWIGEAASETISTKLVIVPGLMTVERSQIKKLLNEKDLMQSLGDAAGCQKASSFLSADRLLVGSFVKNGDQILFNVRIVDGRTGQDLNTAAVTTTENKLFDAFFELSEAIIKSFDKKVVIVDNRPTVIQAPQTERIILTEEQVKKLKEWGTTSPDAFEALNKYLAAKNTDEKIKCCTTAITLDHGYALAYLVRGRTYWEEKKDLDKAIEDITKAIELDATRKEIYNTRGLIYMEKKKTELAMADFNKALELDNSFYEALFNRGGCYHVLGQNEKAIADLEKVISMAPNFYDVYLQLAAVYRSMENFPKAHNMCDKAIKLDPKNPGGWYCQSNIFNDEGKFKEAIEAVNKCLEINPKNDEYYSMRGLIYLLSDEKDKSMTDFKKSIALAPDKPELYIAIGVWYRKFNKEEYDKQISNFTTALTMDPKQSAAYMFRAEAYLDTKQYDKAWADVKKLRELGGELSAELLERLKKESGKKE